MISAGLVFCETEEWSDHGEVKRAVNQRQNELKPANQPTNQNRPTNQPKKTNN